MPSNRHADDDSSDDDDDEGGSAETGTSCFGATSAIPVTLRAVNARVDGVVCLLRVIVGNINDALEEIRYEGAEWGVD